MTAHATHDVAGGLPGDAPRRVRTRAQIRWGLPGGLDVESAPWPADPAGAAPRRATPPKLEPAPRQGRGHAPTSGCEAQIQDAVYTAALTPSADSHDEHRAARPSPAAPAAQPRIERLAVRQSQAVGDPVTPLRSPTGTPIASPARSATRRDEPGSHAPSRAMHTRGRPDDHPAQAPQNLAGAIRPSLRAPDGDAARRPQQVSPLSVPLRPREPLPTPSPAPSALRPAPPQLHIGTIEVTIAAPTPPPPVQAAPVHSAGPPAVVVSSATEPAQRISRALATYGLGQW